METNSPLSNLLSSSHIFTFFISHSCFLVLSFCSACNFAWAHYSQVTVGQNIPSRRNVATCKKMLIFFKNILSTEVRKLTPAKSDNFFNCFVLGLLNTFIIQLFGIFCDTLIFFPKVYPGVFQHRSSGQLCVENNDTWDCELQKNMTNS